MVIKPRIRSRMQGEVCALGEVSRRPKLKHGQLESIAPHPRQILSPRGHYQQELANRDRATLWAAPLS